MEELRSLIFERARRRPGEGLATALRKHVDVLRSVHGGEVALSLDGDAEPRRSCRGAAHPQEALQNAAPRDASRVDVRWRDDGR
jgi:hypothetical protein